MVESIKKVLMRRDGISAEEADELIEDALEDLRCCLDEGDFFGAEEVCETHFGLEPDYLDELMGML